ncbi:MAG: HIT family protein [Kiritimatiellae bacterium]|nr:HIT family protein [Kiritimatiellia bacterium]
MECIFCKIIKGEIPSSKIFEDDHVVAFLDIGPCEKGHTLVVPKCHAARITDLPAEELLPAMEAVRRIAKLLCARLGCDGFNVLQNNGECAGQTVPHVHFHVVPRWNGRGKPTWKEGKYDSPEEMAAIHAKLVNG